MKIKTIDLTYVRVFLLIKNKDCILIDAGLAGDGSKIIGEIDRLGLNLNYIIITHAHYDHAGGLAEVVRQKPVPVICHSCEMSFLKKGRSAELIPHGRTMAELVRHMNLSDKDTERFEPTDTEYLTIDQKTSLSAYGFDGYLLPLAGHTDGSICVFTPKDCICGDTVFNVSEGHFPPIYNNVYALIETFHYLKTCGCRYIYPSHGKRFKAKDIIIPQR